MGGPGESLSPAQLRALRRLVRSEKTIPAVSRRAGWVLDEHRARTTGARRQAGVARQTSAKWFKRFQDTGPAGLIDATRSGRPSETGALTERILTAPLLGAGPRCTTRTVAQQAGCSQSAVARQWRRSFFEQVTPLPDDLPTGGLSVLGAWSGREGSALIVGSPQGDASNQFSQPFMRSNLRPALQTLLAADVASTSSGRRATRAEDAKWSQSERAELNQFVETVARRFAADGVSCFTVCSSARVADAMTRDHSRWHVYRVDPGQWQGLLLSLGPRLDPAAATSLSGAQADASRWAHGNEASLRWIATTDNRSTERPSGVRRPNAPLALSESIADEIVATLLADISGGRLRGGDRITESHLTRAVRASRAQVRDALRLLGSRGVVELQTHRGAVVPEPTASDIVETYAARRALGALIVRRTAESANRRGVAPLTEALADMRRLAATGDAIATGDLDLRLQDVMATTVDMKRIPGMFLVLTVQLRIFVALLQIRYAYSIGAMCDDNARLLQLVAAGDATGAVRVWNEKMNDAAQYMLSQL